MPKVKDIENEQLINVLEIVVEHCVDEHIVDDTLCRTSKRPYFDVESRHHYLT